MEVREVLRSAGIPVRPGGQGWLRAPAIWRGSRDFNLAINADSGHWILHSTGEKGSWEELLRLCAMDPLEFGKISPAKPGSRPSGTTQAQALELWNAAFWLSENQDYRKPFKDLKRWREAGFAYLRNRGIPEEAIQIIASQVRVIGDTRTAMLLLIPLSAPFVGGEVTGLQRIRLDFSGKKYPWPVEEGVGESKRMLGPRKVGEGGWSTGWWLPSRIYPERVLICEGPETAIALQGFTGRAVWCLASANGMDMARIEYLAEQGTTSVCIAGDCDVPGIVAAANIALRIRKNFPSWQVTVAIPSQRKTDWLDVLREQGPEQALVTFRESIEIF